MNKRFENRTALISGGLGDIGRAVALALADQGADIAIADIKEYNEAKPFLDELALGEIKCVYQKVDVSDAQAVKNWVLDVEASLGVADIIIVNAATVTMGNIGQLTAEQWSAELGVNLNGAFFMSKFAAERLVENQKAGRIVFVGSWAAHAVHSNIAAYSVSKAAVRMLCQCMALEFAQKNILVNEIAPGFVNAGLSAKIWSQNPELSVQAAAKVPVKKLISAQQVASQILHLCDFENEHITGSTLLMDGGLSLL